MVFFNIKVVPNSGKNDIELVDVDSLKVYLKSTPEKGKANSELISLLSKKLKLPQFSFLITSGMTTRNKRIKIATNLSQEDLIKKLIVNG